MAGVATSNENVFGKIGNYLASPSQLHVWGGMVAAMAVMTLFIATFPGIFGSASVVSPHIYNWTIVGLSAGATVCSLGFFSPTTLTTLTLGILGLTGVLSVHAVALGTLITLPVGFTVQTIAYKIWMKG